MAAEKARAELDRQLAILEGHLSGRTFLVGQAITLADVIVAWSLLVPYLTVRHAGLPTLDWRRKGNCTGKLDMCMAMTMAIANASCLVYPRPASRGATTKRQLRNAFQMWTRGPQGMCPLKLCFKMLRALPGKLRTFHGSVCDTSG